MSQVRFVGVTKRYGSVLALDALDMEIGEGEFLTLLGPSGCGKTTTLRLVAGFLEPSEGRIYFDGEDVTSLPPERRFIGMVFQDYALFPHLTVAENVGFAPRERGMSRAAIRQRVSELLDLVRLPGLEDRYPAQLSGGQQQRIALARAVAFPPRVLLMDEPLGALDLKLREVMQLELRRIQQELRITTVYVTHDQTEAMNMSDRIAVMNGGRVVQLGSAEEIYYRPRTTFVADFVGKINFLSGRAAGHADGVLLVSSPCGTLRAAPAAKDVRGAVTMAIRPEHMKVLEAGACAEGMNVLSARVESYSFTGNLQNVIVRTENGVVLTVETRPEVVTAAVGESIRVAWSPKHSTVLTEE